MFIRRIIEDHWTSKNRLVELILVKESGIMADEITDVCLGICYGLH